MATLIIMHKSRTSETWCKVLLCLVIHYIAVPFVRDVLFKTWRIWSNHVLKPCYAPVSAYYKFCCKNIDLVCCEGTTKSTCCTSGARWWATAHLALKLLLNVNQTKTIQYKFLHGCSIKNKLTLKKWPTIWWRSASCCLCSTKYVCDSINNTNRWSKYMLQKVICAETYIVNKCECALIFHEIWAMGAYYNMISD